MKKNLYLNDVNIGNYGIFINSDTYLNAPQIDYNDYKVPARNGSVIQYNKRFENVVRKFECYIPDTQNVQTALDQLKLLIYDNPGYLKIVSDYQPDFFMYGYLAQEIEVKPFNQELSATFELYFSCMPQKIRIAEYDRFIPIFNTPITNDFTILNVNNSEMLREILSYVPDYVETFDTYALCKLTQLGLSGNVRFNSIYKGRIFVICQYTDNEPTFVDFLVAGGGFDVISTFEVPSQYNTSSYYLCVLQTTDGNASVTSNIQYGSNYSQSIYAGVSYGVYFDRNDSIYSSGDKYTGALGTIQLLFPDSDEYGLTDNNIQSNYYMNGDGVIAFNDAYIKIDWYQMWLDGILPVVRECIQRYTISGRTRYFVALQVDLMTKRCFATDYNTGNTISLDKYCTIYGDFKFNAGTKYNAISISRRSDLSGISPTYQDDYYIYANIHFNWWKL